MSLDFDSFGTFLLCAGVPWAVFLLMMVCVHLGRIANALDRLAPPPAPAMLQEQPGASSPVDVDIRQPRGVPKENP